jgi:hypothetical protein
MRCFELHGDLAILRLSDDCPIDQAGSKVKSAIALARGLRIPRILIVASSLSAPHENLFSKEWVSAFCNDVRIFVVANREMIDPDMLGVRCFASEEQAMGWLRAEEF